MSLIAQPDQLIGDDRALYIKDVQRLISYLRETIEYFEHAPRSKQRLSSIHNFYTIYTLFFLQFTTGYRGVRNPLQDYSDIDCELLLISDKDTVDGYMTRVAYISNPLANQLRMYQQHRLNIIHEISIYEPNCNIANSYKSNTHPVLQKQADIQGLDLKKIIKSSMNRDVCFPFLFFLNEKMQFQEVRPDTYLKPLKHLGLFPNSGRHFFRSYLVQKSCKTEIIDAAMGHWNHGNESYGPYSCMSPWEFKELIKPFIDEMISECGWIPLKGGV